VAASTEQKLDYLLKKIGYTASKTGLAEDSSLSGTKKAPFAEAIPSPLVTPSTTIWNESALIPTTPPGSDTAQVRVYLAGTSGHRMTVDSTVSGSRAFIAYSTYNNTSTAILGDWIDPQFGDSYIIKVYKGDPNSGGVLLSAAGAGSNDTWFFDYSSGVLNFNGTVIPSGVTDTNIYIVGYRYIGVKGLSTAGITTSGTSTLKDLNVTGVSTFAGNINANGNIIGDNSTNISGINSVTATSLFANLTGNVSGIATYTSEWIVTSNGSSDYRFTGPGFDATENDPTIYLARGQQYKFTNHMGAHPFEIRTAINGSAYNDGVVNNGVSNGTLTWDVQMDAPNVLYYQCTAHAGMVGKIYIGNSGNSINVGSGVTITGGGIDVTGVITATSFSGTLQTAAQPNITSVGTLSSLNVTGDVSIGGTLTYEDVTNIDSVGLITARTGIKVLAGGINAVGVVTANSFDGSLATTNLTGTITNAQLAGSIANDKLANSTVSYGGVSLALGETDATPAFNLTDATNYPFTSLTGITTTILGDATPKLGGDLNGNGKSIFNVGIITATTFSGDISGVGATFTSITGTLITAAQTNITSVGTLGALTVSGDINANGNIVGDNATNISGINSVTATTYFGDGTKLIGVSTAGISTDGTTTLKNLEVTGVSTTATLNVSGVSTFVGIATFQSVDINNGAIDGTNIGFNHRANGQFVNLDANGTLGVDGTSTLNTLNVTGVSTFTTTLNNNQVVSITNNGTVGANGLKISSGGNGSGSKLLELLSNNQSSETSRFEFLADGTFRLPNDNAKIRLGASDDLLIRYDGSDGSITQTGSGNLHIRGNGTDQIKLQAKSGEQSIICYSDAAVELYYDNTKRFETTNTGVSITGNSVVSGNVTAVDGTFSGNVSIGGTLTYEDVTNIDSVGLITARTGIKVLAGGINAVGVVTGTNGLSGTILTAAQTNITSVGTLGSLTVSGNINANGNIVGDTATNISGINSVTATSFHGDGSALTNLPASTPDKIEEGDSSVEVIDSGTGRVAIKVDGAHVARFNTENNNRTYMVIGNNVAAGSNYGSNDGNLIIASNTTYGNATPRLRFFTTGTGMSDDKVTGIIDFAAQQSGTGGQTVSKIESSLRDSVENKSDLIFSTSNGGSPTEKLRIRATGNVGIATTNPTSKLHVVGNALVTGVLTATSFSGDGSGLTNVGVDTVTVNTNSIDTGTLNVTGISTLVGFSTFNSGIFVAGISTFSANANTLNVNTGTTNAAINIQYNGVTKGSLIPESDAFKIGVISSENLLMHLNQFGGNTSDFIVKSSGSELFKIDSGTIESTFISTDTGSSAGPVVNLYRNSASPADADYLGQIKFQGESDTGVQRNYAKITGKILDASNGTEDGIIEFAHIKAGAQTITGRFRSDSLQLLNGTNLSVNGTTTFEDDVTFTGASNNIVFDASDNALEFADDAKAKFGTGGDLEIYHDGSNSYISDSGTGALTIEASTLLIENAAGNQNMIQAHQSGAVNLYYANSKKFETTNTGVVVTGILTATSFSGDGSNLSNVGFTTSVGTFNASSGVATIDSFAYATEDYKVAEYTLHFTNGSDIQAQKLLVMQDGSTAYSQEFAVMSSASQLVSLDATISGANVLVRATPESGISGTTTFRWRRIVQE